MLLQKLHNRTIAQTIQQKPFDERLLFFLVKNRANTYKTQHLLTVSPHNNTVGLTNVGYDVYQQIEVYAKVVLIW